jgi:hypothetical protein
MAAFISNQKWSKWLIVYQCLICSTRPKLRRWGSWIGLKVPAFGQSRGEAKEMKAIPNG